MTIKAAALTSGPGEALPPPGANWKPTTREFGIVMAAVLAIQALTFVTQQRIDVNGGQGYDGMLYYHLAQQFADGDHPSGASRAARRIGTPFLAALVDSDNLIRGFTIVNASAALVSALLLAAWFRTYVRRRWLRIALVVLYATHWLQLVRFTIFYPVLSDACAQACCFAGLNCIASYERKPGRGALIGIAAISAVGVFFREVVLLIPLAFLFARNPGFQHRLRFPYVRITKAPRLLQWLPILLAGAALWWISGFVIATDPEFSAPDHLIERAYSRRLITYVLGWMVAFGPVLFVVLFDWRTMSEFFSEHKAYLVYTLGVVVLGWVASLEAERHALNWGSPIVYLLLGRTIERHEAWFRSAPFTAFLLGAQAVVNRLFLTIPQPDGDYQEHLPAVILTPVGEHASYLHLFPDYVSVHTASIQFAQYAVLGAVILMWMSRRVYLQSACGDPGRNATR